MKFYTEKKVAMAAIHLHLYKNVETFTTVYKNNEETSKLLRCNCFLFYKKSEDRTSATTVSQKVTELPSKSILW